VLYKVSGLLTKRPSCNKSSWRWVLKCVKGVSGLRSATKWAELVGDSSAARNGRFCDFFFLVDVLIA
jgi:hypothetical protein